MNSSDLQNGKTNAIDGSHFRTLQSQESLGKFDSKTGIVTKCGLTSSDEAQVEALADAVREVDGVIVKFNLPRQVLTEDSEPYPGEANDILYYVDGLLVGYAPLNGDDGDLEITVAVLPSHRRQGIFRQLLREAVIESRQRGVANLQLVGYPASLSCTAVTQSLKLTYVSSEYRMDACASQLPNQINDELKLVRVERSDAVELTELLNKTFDESRSLKSTIERLCDRQCRYYFAEIEGMRIGQIGALDVDGRIYIRSFGILREYRRRGYGRQLLSTTMQAMIAENYTHFELDVATYNSTALGLYESCGFRETCGYDYYNVPITGLE